MSRGIDSPAGEWKNAKFRLTQFYGFKMTFLDESRTK